MKPTDYPAQLAAKCLSLHTRLRRMSLAICAWVGLALVAHAVPTPFAYRGIDNPSGLGSLSVNGTTAYTTELNGSSNLTVVSAHSSCVPAVGTYSNLRGTAIAVSAAPVTEGKTQYVPAGWTMSGDSPHVGTGSSFTMTLSRDSVLTWNWATNYWLDTAVSGSGTVSVASGWQAAGSSVTVVATPGSGMRFLSWSGDTSGCVTGNDRIIVPITGVRGALTANFATDDDFTVVALPDTQNYSSSYGSIWTSMTSWIVNNRSALNIQFVSHLGDIVNTYNSSSQWTQSVAGMNLLNGQVPYLMTVGNHDINSAQTDNNYLNHFGPNNSRWKTGGNYYPWWGGASPSGLSSYAKLTICGRPFIFLNLDMDCPTPELNWAQAVINANHNVLTFLSVHNWLAETGGSGSTGTGNGMRGRCHTTYTSAPQGNSPDAVWTNFVQPNNEIFAIICGHNFAQYNLAENNNAGKPVQEIMVDYQTLPNGGNGFMRLMKFRPSQRVIENTTYSPSLDRYMTQPATSVDSTGMLDLTDPYGSAFTLNIDFDHRFDGFLSVKYAGGPADATTVTTPYRPGSAVLMTAPDVQSGQTLYRCSGWSLSGSQAGSGPGNSKSLVMNGDATLTWTWATNYWLETSETGDGQVSVYSGWQAANTPVTLAAVPNGTATFLRWSGDTNGCTLNGAHITVPMNRPYGLIQAEFSPVQQSVNLPPVFSGMTVKAVTGIPVAILEASILAHASDPENDPVSISSVATTSADGAAITQADGALTYTSNAEFAGTDTFVVTLTDGRNLTSYQITVEVVAAPEFTTTNPARINPLPGGSQRISFNGIPGRVYGIERSTDMMTWTQIAAVTAAPNSSVRLEDKDPPQPVGFYRIAFPAR